MSNNALNIGKLYFKDTSFAHLMNKRIYNVLLVASNYDAFTLEEDGRIDEQIFNEYHSLNLRYPPRFTLANSENAATRLLHQRPFDLVILMPNNESIDTFEYAKTVKQNFPELPWCCWTRSRRPIPMCGTCCCRCLFRVR